MIFIDTGAFIAKYIKNDQHHNEALKRWKMIGKNEKLFTSSHILDEMITLLARKTNYPFAYEKGKRVYASNSLNILRADFEDEINGLRYFKKYMDKKISFTDSISMALIERYKIKKIFTFDSHFRYLNLVII